jgi:hypothetical protein
VAGKQLNLMLDDFALIEKMLAVTFVSLTTCHHAPKAIRASTATAFTTRFRMRLTSLAFSAPQTFRSLHLLWK